MEENKIKIQHYVPRVYLKNFSISRRQTQVHCFDKHKVREYPVNTRNIACESYFYDGLPSDNNQSIENHLSKVDGRFNPIYSKLIQEKNLDCLIDREKVLLAYFIVLQELRTREHREFIRDLALLLKNRLDNEKLSKRLEEDLRKMDTEDSIKIMQIESMIQDGPKYAMILYQMKWILFMNRTDMPYWTSDHPIVRHNSMNSRPHGTLGLASKGIEIYFPLSPELSLCLTDPTTYSLLPDQYESFDLQHTIFQNCLQVNQSTRHIFSNENDFSFAKKMIKDNPSLCDIDKKRLSSNGYIKK